MPKFSSLRMTRVFVPLTALGAVISGCSAEVSRFNFPSSGLGYNNQTSSISKPSENPYASRSGSSGYGGYDNGSGDVRRAEIPPARFDDQPRSFERDSGGYDRDYGQRSTSQYDQGDYSSSARRSNGGYDRQYGNDRSQQKPAYERVQTKTYDAAPRSTQQASSKSSSSAAAGGQTIEVQSGDTLYGLSRQHGVSVQQLMAANDLSSHPLQPGQQLVLPSGGQSAAPSREPVRMASAERASPAADAPGTYTMQPGDSLYAIARNHNVNYGELQRHNGITDSDVRRLRPGTVLKIPGADGASGPAVAEAEPSAAPAMTAAPSTKVSPQPSATPPPAETLAAASNDAAVAEDATSSSSTPKVLNASKTKPEAKEKQVAALETPAQTSDAPKSGIQSSSGNVSGLRWPVEGRVISPFGPRNDGTHNDGINFSVPVGADIHAADAGEVIYVGDELKAYGKLVLLRHDNGWVTAYAHNDKLLVKRGDKVRRGDVVAKAGKTGPVDQPQLHFELRQDSKAVDPTSFMEKR